MKYPSIQDNIDVGCKGIGNRAMDFQPQIIDVVNFIVAYFAKILFFW